MAGGRMYTFHSTPLDPPLVIGYRNHQKSLAHFSHLAPLVLFFFTKRPSQNEGAMAQWPPPLNTLLLKLSASIFLYAANPRDQTTA